MRESVLTVWRVNGGGQAAPTCAREDGVYNMLGVYAHGGRNVHTHKVKELIAREMTAKELRVFIDLPK